METKQTSKLLFFNFAPEYVNKKVQDGHRGI